MIPSVRQYEKYRQAYEWVGKTKPEQMRMLFSAWFAESDWDDPSAAWKEYTTK